MRIRLAVIPSEKLQLIKTLVESLQKAVESGDIDCMENITDKILDVTAEENSIDLSEEDWQKFIMRARSNKGVLKSDYFLYGEVCQSFFPNMTSDSLVLQLPLNEIGGECV